MKERAINRATTSLPGLCFRMLLQVRKVPLAAMAPLVPPPPMVASAPARLVVRRFIAVRTKIRLAGKGTIHRATSRLPPVQVDG